MSAGCTEQTAAVLFCPECHAGAPESTVECARCGLSLDWIGRFPEFRQALSTPERTSASDGAPPVIEPASLRPLPLSPERATVLGRSTSSTQPLYHSSVELQHCVFVRQPLTGDYWLADTGTSGGTWVNRRRTASARLEDGDLIQIGRFAWAFNAADSYLVPLDPIDGTALKLHSGAGLSGRLGPLPDIHIPAGQFVAITGASGAGKSTLLKAIAGLPGGRDSGHITVDGRDIDQSPDWFRSALGYVSQAEFVPDQLSARQAVYYSGRLRGETADHEEAVLLQMGLPRDRWDACVAELSGGQALRVRTAAELISNPRLLLLDEPGSGLDLDRERHLMKLLRTLSYRGCTVVIVSHNTAAVAVCDRVLEVEKDHATGNGSIVSDTSLEPARDGGRPAADSNVQDNTAPAPIHPSPDPLHASLAETPYRCATGRFRKQILLLIQREFDQIRHDWKRRLLVPLLIIPAVFALALGAAVRPTADDLLGFFAVLSCIWMGGSLSLLQIAGERSVYEHERHLFLRTSAYVTAKAATLQILAVIQIPVFVLLLTAVRTGMDMPGLSSPLWTGLSLLPVAGSGVGLGLLLSALAKHSKELAGFLWPLVMIVQIVFSVPVCCGSGKTLRSAYGEFHLHDCFWSEQCTRRATRWMPSSDDTPGRWLCRSCSFDAASKPDGKAEAVYENRNRPNRLASAISYLTVSRYGDIAVRSAGTGDEEGDRGSAPLSRWWWESVLTLMAASVLLPVATGIVLAAQRKLDGRIFSQVRLAESLKWLRHHFVNHAAHLVWPKQ